jgi:hypothetical protein
VSASESLNLKVCTLCRMPAADVTLDLVVRGAVGLSGWKPLAG